MVGGRTGAALFLLGSGCIWSQEAYEVRRAWLTDGDGDGLAEIEGDCDDADPDVFPGAVETCDGVDQDCNERVDDAPVNALRWYVDGDGDGLGGEAQSGCDVPEEAVAEGGDCDDADAAIPATEIPYDGVDQDCDGADLVDVDGDGYAGGEAGDDCDDGDVEVFPGAGETWANGVTDNDCDGEREEVRIEYGYDAWTGATSGSQLGRRIAALPDVTGDGLAELIVSAPYDSTAFPAGGAIYSFGSGPPSSVDGTAIYVSGGPDWFMLVEGRDFSDFDRDGTADLIVSAPGKDAGDGHVWIVPAAPETPESLPDQESVVSIHPLEPGTYFGAGASAVDDVTGDGVIDFAVGSPLSSPEGLEYAGTVFVFSGDEIGDIDTTAAEYAVVGGTPGAFIGNVAEPAGDQDQDGYSDLLLGGSVGYIATVLPGGRSHSSLDSDWVFHLGAPDDGITRSIRMVGDLDGDGTRDLAVIAEDFLFFTALSLAPSRTPSDRTAAVDMADKLTYFYDVADLGDLDGDGRSETLVPAQYVNTIRGSWASVFFGSEFSFGSVAQLDDAALAAVCIRPNAAFGYRVAVSPDVDGDGFRDIALAGYSDDEAGSDAGAVAILPVPQ